MIPARPCAAMLLCSLFFSLVAGPLAAQENLVLNPGFDIDLGDWDNRFGRPGDWDPLDASNSPESGSVLMTHDGVSNGAVPGILFQCHLVTGSTEYTFGSQVYVPPGQPEDTAGQVFAITYPTADCSGDFLQIEFATGNLVEEWVTDSTTFVTEPTAGSLSLSLGTFKPNAVSDPAQAYMDNVFLFEAASGAYRIIDELLSGSWYNPATPGQGIFLDISREINLFFGGWFAWTNVLGEIFWWTVQGGFSGDLATVTIYRSSGGALNDPAAVETVAVGMGEFRFTSCTEGEFRYRFDGDTGYTVIPLSRLAPAFNGCVD